MMVRLNIAEDDVPPATLAEKIIDSSPVIVFVKAADGRYLYVNARYEDAVGVSPEQAIGSRDEDVMAPDVAAAVRENDRKVLLAGQPIQEREVVPRGDEPRTYASVKYPILAAAPASRMRWPAWPSISPRWNVQKPPWFSATTY